MYQYHSVNTMQCLVSAFIGCFWHFYCKWLQLHQTYPVLYISLDCLFFYSKLIPFCLYTWSKGSSTTMEFHSLNCYYTLVGLHPLSHTTNARYNTIYPPKSATPCRWRCCNKWISKVNISEVLYCLHCSLYVNILNAIDNNQLWMTPDQ